FPIARSIAYLPLPQSQHGNCQTATQKCHTAGLGHRSRDKRCQERLVVADADGIGVLWALKWHRGVRVRKEPVRVKDSVDKLLAGGGGAGGEARINRVIDAGKLPHAVIVDERAATGVMIGENRLVRVQKVSRAVRLSIKAELKESCGSVCRDRVNGV